MSSDLNVLEVIRLGWKKSTLEATNCLGKSLNWLRWSRNDLCGPEVALRSIC